MRAGSSWTFPPPSCRRPCSRRPPRPPSCARPPDATGPRPHCDRSPSPWPSWPNGGWRWRRGPTVCSWSSPCSDRSGSRGRTGRIEIRGVKERLLLAHAPRLRRAHRRRGGADRRPMGGGPASHSREGLADLRAAAAQRARARAARANPLLLVTDGQGYRLAIDARQGRRRPVRAADRGGGAGSCRERLEVLREALDLWRGRAYADLDSAPSLAAEATRLEELRWWPRCGAVRRRAGPRPAQRRDRRAGAATSPTTRSGSSCGGCW